MTNDFTWSICDVLGGPFLQRIFPIHPRESDRDMSFLQLVIIHHIQLRHIFLRDIDITITPDVTPVATSIRPATDHIWRDVFSFIRPTDPCKRVDEGGGGVERVIA